MSASRDSDSQETGSGRKRAVNKKSTATRPAAKRPGRKPAVKPRTVRSSTSTRAATAKAAPATRRPAARAKAAATGSREIPASNVAAKADAFELAWEKAQAAAQARRDKQPDAEVTELYKQLLRDKCLRAGTLGAATSVASLIPGLGAIASFAIDGIGDAAYTAELQQDLALTTFALYGRKPNEKERLRIVGWIATFGAGGSELIEQVGKMVARQLAKNLAGRLLRRGLPFAEVAYSTATHLAGTYFVGRRAQLYCIGLSDAESEILLESEKGVKLQVRRMKKLAQESVEAMEQRFGMPGRTLAILFRKLTGSDKS